ncbi:MAG TPA: cytochrome c oxidase subunit II [Gemmatimonadaceae bacterium]
MTGYHRARRLLLAALTPVFVLGLAACSDVPNTIFGAHSEFGHELDHLTLRLLFLGLIVFVVVEGLLIFVLIKFRARPGNPEPKQTHGNTTLEVTWTLIPALILAFIAVPTIKTIFKTEAPAPAGSLQVEVIGHQWWWEFRYPEYGVVTANELYLPVGRTINFHLKTKDVIHSFWVPQLGGKRDLVSNRTNYLWYTPDSSFAWNGFCAEYCGASHSNMRFKVFTVSPKEFDAYIAHQKTGPAFTVAAAAPGADTSKGAASAAAPAQTASAAPAGDDGIWPRDRVPKWLIPETPVPANLTISTTQGDPARGAQLFKTGACIGCHTIQGVSPGVIGPNLTHVGSRYTIAGGLYPNDMKHLALWIKDAPAMKPGSIMPAMGKGLPNAMGAYDDQQIADIAAYLSSLK